MGIMGFTHIITGLLLGTLIIGNALARRHEYMIYRGSSIMLVTIAIISIVLTTFYIYNISYILLVQCPRFNFNAESAFSARELNLDPQAETETEKDADAADRHHQKRHLNRRIPSVEILISYYSRLEGQQMNRHHVILMNYDNHTKQVRRKHRLTDEDQWFVSRDGATRLSPLEKSVSVSGAGNVVADGYVCRAANTQPFSMLAREIEEILREKRDESQEKRSFYIKVSAEQEGTDDEEEFIFLELFSRHICRNERAFAIFLDFFLGFIILVALVTVGTYAYIWAA